MQYLVFRLNLLSLPSWSFEHFISHCKRLLSGNLVLHNTCFFYVLVPLSYLPVWNTGSRGAYHPCTLSCLCVQCVTVRSGSGYKLAFIDKYHWTAVGKFCYKIYVVKVNTLCQMPRMEKQTIFGNFLLFEPQFSFLTALTLFLSVEVSEAIFSIISCTA